MLANVKCGGFSGEISRAAKRNTGAAIAEL